MYVVRIGTYVVYISQSKEDNHIVTVMFSLSTAKISQAHLYDTLPSRDMAKFKPFPLRFNDQLNPYYNNEISVCVRFQLE